VRVFENRVLMRIFGSKDDIIGGWRKLHNEELHNLHSSPNIIRMNESWRMRCAEHVARMGRRGMCIGFWWEMQKGRPLRRRGRRWEDNIKMYLKEKNGVV
jgi:hypothetical protein